MDQLLSYSSSEGELDDDECTPPPRKKTRTLPPLSGSLLPKVPVDDPALHQGRIRTTPHVEGQWAAYVYVPVFIEKREKLGLLLKDSLETARGSVDGLNAIGEDADGSDKVTELHISLTRPTYVRAHQREELKRAVRAAAKQSSS
jgi:U6 snRNA phosphodiesterase